MSDDDFLSYLRQNSMFNPRFKHISSRERKIGRKRPKYCELHEAMILQPRKMDGPPLADHSHSNGKYRGWICATCNTGLLPEIDRLKDIGIEAEDIKTFLNLLVDYVFTDGDILNRGLLSKK